MKMSKTAYQMLETAISKIIEKFPYAECRYYSEGLTERRYCFDMFYAATSKSNGSLPTYWTKDFCYDKGMNDDHIYTALKKILKVQRQIWSTS